MSYQIYKYKKMWGPYDEASVYTMVESSQVSKKDLICNTGQSDWATIQNRFFDALQPLIPEQKQRVANKKARTASWQPKRSSFWAWKIHGAFIGLIVLVCFLIFRQSPMTQDERLIREAVGEALNKPSGELVQEDFERVTSLKIPSCGLADISLLERMPNLEELALPHNQIEDLSPLKELKSLKYLDLAGNEISDLRPIKDLPNLKMLHLGGNSLKEVTSLAGLKNITELDLGYNQLENSNPLASLPNLEVINLTGNRIKSLGHLFVLGRLKLVILGENSGISQSERILAQARLSNCQFIW